MQRPTDGRRERGLHVTIGSCPSPHQADLGVAALLASDLELTKSAILYADEATLFSPMSNLLSRVCSTRAAMTDKSFKRQVAALDDLTKTVDVQPELRALLDVCLNVTAKKHLSSKEIIFSRTLAKRIHEMWKQFEKSGLAVSEAPLIKQFFRSFDDGLLDFHTFQDPSPRIPDFDVFTQFVDRIRSTLADNSTYPLLDDNTGLLMSFQSLAGTLTIPEHGAQRARQISMVASLFEKLPQFELASLDEIIDIRSELRKYLVRFRSGIIKFSTSVNSAPWDTDFPYDAEQVFLTDVAPALQDIDDQTKSNSYLSKLTNRYAEHPTNFAVPTLSVALTHWSGFSEILTIILGVGPLAVNVIDVFNQWRATQAQIAQNQMFFYYRAKKKLS